MYLESCTSLGVVSPASKAVRSTLGEEKEDEEMNCLAFRSLLTWLLKERRCIAHEFNQSELISAHFCCVGDFFDENAS